MENWKTHLFKMQDVLFDENKIANFPIKQNLGTEFHDTKPKGANLRELSDSSDMTQSTWEFPDYVKILKAYLSPQNNGICADLGCGDGRFVKCLIDFGFNKIIAVESHYNSLLSLSNYLDETNDHDKVLLVKSSVETLPFKDNVLDTFMSINVFYYLNENQGIAISEAYRVLKKDGVGISTYHNYEAILLRSLVFNGIKDFLTVLAKQNYREVKDEKSPYRFNTQEPDKEENLYKNIGFEICDVKGISLFHQFLHYIQKENPDSESLLKENKALLFSFFNYLSLNSQLQKTKIIKLKK
ncbi:MAG: hypothetical protein COA97_06715 [Flavobacteriales bacterium]|nr:MAG: hypothetical protein COA97_06715 [Flavobacteriales bacterium]